MAGWTSLGQRNDRPVVAPFWVAGAGLVLVTVAAWIFVVASSGGDSMDMVPNAGAYIGSWTVMMAAMMLPSVAPFALVVAAEMLLPHGPLLGKIGGVALITAGIVVAL